MEHSIGVGAIVGLVFASSIYVWNNDKYSSTQKTLLLICILFPPAQWLGILIVSIYNSNIENSTPEKKLDSTISNLTELKEKGILTEEEYKTKVKKIEVEKTERSLKNSLEYKQLESLYKAGVLSEEEFVNKIRLIKFDVLNTHTIIKKKNYKSIINSFGNYFYKLIIIPFLWLFSITIIFGTILTYEPDDDTLRPIIMFIIGIFTCPIVFIRVVKFLYYKFNTYLLR